MTVGSDMQGLGPELVGQDDGPRGARSVIGGTQEPAEDGAKAHDLEVAAIDDSGRDLARLSEALDGEGHLRERAERGDGLEVPAQIVDFRDRERRVVHLKSGRALANVEEAGFVAVGQRAQEDGPNHGEDGCVGADTEREGEGDGDPQGADAGEGAGSDPEVTEPGHEVHDVLHQ